MRIDGPTNPFHISRAYGVRPPAPPAPPAPSVRAAGLEDAPEAFRATGVASLTPNLRRLVAAQVPGIVDFSSGEARPGAATLPMYRHPADRNAAATSVAVGRAIDIAG